MLLTTGNRLSAQQLRRLEQILAADHPTNEIGAVWDIKELPRELLAARDLAEIRSGLWAPYAACAAAGMTETTQDNHLCQLGFRPKHVLARWLCHRQALGSMLAAS